MIKSILLIIFITNIILQAQEFDTEFVDTNNIKMFLQNDGSTGATTPEGTTTLDSNSILFQTGFLIGGYRHDTLWGNGIFNLMDNYIPGNIPAKYGAKYKFYIVKSSDPAFGTSWNEWKKAVEQGALFYDGNGNGIYDPVDKNGNGIWDENEDRPDLLGDFTAWCVVNDGNTRKGEPPNATMPLDIEVRQTVFAYSPETNQNLSNVIFARYIIENKNRDDEVLEDAYFGLAVDPDIGDYVDDRMGSDSVENYGYGYNHGTDEKFGINSPAVLVDLLQGVQTSIPNVTFIDNNNNNQYDEGIDTAIDSTILNLGPYLGKRIIKGSRSIDATSIVYLGRSWCVEPPVTISSVINYLRGLNGCGDVYDPCTFYLGNYNELDNCEKINPKFVFSGDPVTGKGWRQVWHQDSYFIISSGPFRLVPRKPITITFAIIAGRGTDSLNSITVAREIDEYVQKFYENNFQEQPVGISFKRKIGKEFKLYQNYPNPFNPSTTIKYTIPKVGIGKAGNSEVLVNLKIYDVLGREMATLVNERQQAGTYQVTFDASSVSGDLPSGIYFYKLQAGNFIQTRKMLLIK